MKMPDKIDNAMLATCGVNCSVCMAYLRTKNKCNGCNANDGNKPYHCTKCRIKHCDFRIQNKYDYCFQCDKKCQRLKQLDKRYVKNYNVSLLNNLEQIKENGIDLFMEKEKETWTCKSCGGIVSQHSGMCSECQIKKSEF